MKVYETVVPVEYAYSLAIDLMIDTKDAEGEFTGIARP